MDLLTIMDLDFLAEDKSLVNWKGGAEQSVIEGKHFIIKYSPKLPLGGYLYDTPCIMRFKYREDYEKLKKVNNVIGNILHKLSYERIPKCLKLVRELEEFVRKCNFLKIDYDDGRLFRTKFSAINLFLIEGEDNFNVFNKFKEHPSDEDYENMLDLLDYDIIPKVLKIKDLLQQIGLFPIYS